MSNPTEPDSENMRAVFPTNSDSLSSSTSTSPPASTDHTRSLTPERGELPYTTNPPDKSLRSSSPINNGNNDNNNSDGTNPQTPHPPSTVSLPNPHSRILHTPSHQEPTVSSHDDEMGQPIDDSSTFQEKLSGPESVWQSAEPSVSSLSAALERREDGETARGERRRLDGSSDRYFVIDKATRVEDQERARAEGPSERQGEGYASPMRREGISKEDRERRVRELREGVLEEEGKL